MAGGVKRVYSSNVRAEGARRTRALIVTAATDLFVHKGFEATTIAEVAAAAGVARPTVLATFGSKPALLKTVLDEALAGDDEPAPVRDRPWFAPVWQATTAREVTTAYAGVCLLIASRAGLVVEAMRRASDSSPELAELWQGWLRGRRAGAEMVVRRQVVLDALRPDLTPQTAGDVLWTLNDPDLHVSLVGQRGWPPEQFRRWLAGTMAALLLDPGRADLPGPPEAG
jgi:AcrR family transcriptional regulator